jgi:transcriptional regulator with XRE-family HTH domain
MEEINFFEWAARRGYNGQRLADRLGYSAEHLSRIKTGKQAPSVDFVTRCMLVFGVEIKQFFPDADTVAALNPSCESKQ